MSDLISRFKRQTHGWQRFLRLLPAFLLIIVLVIGCVKGWHLYQNALIVYEDVTDLQASVRGPTDALDSDVISRQLLELDGDLDAFTQEAKPFLWLSPKLGWIPTYGGDLVYVTDFLELADHLVDASVTSLQAAEPLLDEINSQDSALDPAGITALLVDAQPRLLEARHEFDQALDARNGIQVDRLSPRLRELLVDQLDPLLQLMDDGLSLSRALPVILGADGAGPKTYLILAQNEDELRPTGGFITSVGKLVVDSGQIVSLDFEGVDYQEDWSKPFPSAPWQLQEYMNTSVLILRDSNWFADFPTSALWAKYLYAYNHSHAVDGVIAFDQQLLVLLLRALGPLDVDGAPYAITSDNVVAYMRTAKEPPKDGTLPADWYRKEFIGDIADAVFRELVGGQNNDWRGLAMTLLQALDERHLLLQFDDPMAATLLAKYGWDNAVRPSTGDFLMTTDTNIGFNKTNALMDISLAYDVNLTDLSTPTGVLVANHKNNSSKDVQCIHWDSGLVIDEYSYPMNRCYWSYFRVYKQAGVELLNASPHVVPADWMLLGRNVPARVDVLDEEINGVLGFGTLLVVPGGQSFSTSFDFALPALVISHEDGTDRFTYRLRVQKQPGTLANPLVVRIHLPNRSQVEMINMDAQIQDNNLLIETDLLKDVYLELIFRVP